MKRPISQDFPGYDILLNPFSVYIEEGDFGIFLANSKENMKKIWKNQAIFEENKDAVSFFFFLSDIYNNFKKFVDVLKIQNANDLFEIFDSNNVLLLSL